MSRVVHIIGNGSSSIGYKPQKGIKITCNLPPFPVANAYGTVIIDFKMMMAMTEGSVQVPGDWICGARPYHYLNAWPDQKLRFAKHIKEFYLDLPPYAGNYTNFNCGHVATHYAANKLKGTEIHMYGFNSIFDYDLRSCTDFYLNSDRGNHNNLRLTQRWRPIWTEMFKEFSETQFVLYHMHDRPSIELSENVEIRKIKK